MVQFGVSPAFVVSLHGQKFTVENFCQSLPVMKELGFSAFQPEIFFKEALPEWTNDGALQVANQAVELGLKPSQFVAHFMHEFFSCPALVYSNQGVDQLKQAVECAKAFEECRVFTIPVLPFTADWTTIDAPEYDRLNQQLIEKIRACLAVITDAGLRMAFEIVPFSIIGNNDRFLEICRIIDSPKLGVNLDTGHAWATRDTLALLPYKLKNRIFGLHLKDNNSDHNLPLAPGKGTIDWKSFLYNLSASGYTGSFDIEIGCSSDQVRIEYTEGLKYIQSCLKVQM